MKRFLAFILVVLTLASSVIAAPPAPTKQRAGMLPLTYANVVAYFKEARLHPTEVQKRCTVFFEGEFKNKDVYDYCLIIVENSDEDIQVTFYLTDAHEMNWVTEFLDSPFFTPAETQGLFGLMNSGDEARARKVGRFRVDYQRWQPRHATILVFSFTDAQSQRQPNRSR
jgi:hypothetical protein